MRGKGTRDQRRKERERKGWRRKRKKKDFRRQQLRIQLQGGDVHVGKALDTLCPFFDFVLDDQPVHLRRFDRFFWHCFIRPFSTGDQKSNIGWMRQRCTTQRVTYFVAVILSVAHLRHLREVLPTRRVVIMKNGPQYRNDEPILPYCFFRCCLSLTFVEPPLLDIARRRFKD